MIKAIYVITNLVNGKQYVGQSIEPNHRFISHISRAKTNSDNTIIHSAISKYGAENFKLEIVEWTEDYNNAEQYWITKLNTISPNGYNMLEGGQEPPRMLGENHPRNTISDYQVINIHKDLLDNKLTQKQIAKKYDTSCNIITAINNGMTHKINDVNYPLRRKSPYHLSTDDIEEIQWLLINSKHTIEEIAIYYNKSVSPIKHINVGRNYFNESLNYPLRKGRGSKQNQPVETTLVERGTATIDT